MAIYLRAGRVVLFLAVWETEESSATEIRLEFGKGKLVENRMERARERSCVSWIERVKG